MKGRFSLFFIFFLLFPTFLIFLFIWWKWTISPVDSQSTQEKIFVIPKGESTTIIIDRLKEENLIKSPLAFRLLLYKEGLEGKLQAGDFHVSPKMNAREIAQELAHGRMDAWVTLPEGLRTEEIFQILKKENFKLDFSEWFNLTENKEGYLFPDTYLVPQEASASTIVNIILNNFKEKTKTLSKEVPFEDLILASLIEREAKVDEDRPMVAGILRKRWQNGWPLEVDATVQYALGAKKCRADSENEKCWWQVIASEDLKIDSPYNTYKNKGLPPGPICNPGLAAIAAALEPQETKYWFYLSDKEGKLHFAETLEEQESNIKKYLE